MPDTSNDAMIPEREAEDMLRYARYDAAAAHALLAISKTLRYIAGQLSPTTIVGHCPEGCQCDNPRGRPFADVLMEHMSAPEGYSHMAGFSDEDSPNE